jgi:hypothetical protein
LYNSSANKTIVVVSWGAVAREIHLHARFLFIYTFHQNTKTFKPLLESVNSLLFAVKVGSSKVLLEVLLNTTATHVSTLNP